MLLPLWTSVPSLESLPTLRHAQALTTSGTVPLKNSQLSHVIFATGPSKRNGMRLPPTASLTLPSPALSTLLDHYSLITAADINVARLARTDDRANQMHSIIA